MSPMATFLDRDGVLIEDRHFVTESKDFHLLPGVPAALTLLKRAGYALVLVSNQAVVARGMISEHQLAELHESLNKLLVSAGAPRLDAIYACPHHPQATVAAYRIECECRKPRPGSILHASREHGYDLSRSFTVGDRMTDIAAGATAGCRTVLVESPETRAASIVTLEPLDPSLRPDFVCSDLLSAALWIVSQP